MKEEEEDNRFKIYRWCSKQGRKEREKGRKEREERRREGKSRE